MHILLSTLIFSLGFNIVMFIPAYFLKTDKLTDLSYSLTFVAIVFYGFLNTSIGLPSILLFTMIILWAIRLGVYLFIRIQKIKKDNRFNGMRENFFSFLKFWLLQGFTVWVVMIPVIIFFKNDIQNFSIWFLIGILVWITGLFIESIADWQKYNFIKNKENEGLWVDKGLWKYSRHPNYFGEILIWIGIFIYTILGLSLIESFIGFISPVYISLLIILISGIPLLEKSANKRWGENPKYQQYKKNTSVLIPLPPKKNSSL